MQNVDKKNTWEEEDTIPQDTSYKDSSYQDMSYQDTSYQDMPYQDTSYQDMPYTTWKIRDTGEQKQVQTKIFIKNKSFLSSLFTINTKSVSP